MSVDTGFVGSMIIALEKAVSRPPQGQSWETLDADFTSVPSGGQSYNHPFSALQQIAFVEARYAGLQEADAHDCAMEIVLRSLQQTLQVKPCASLTAARAILRYDLTPEQRVAWLRRCARNSAYNYRLRAVTRQQKEAACHREHLGDAQESMAASAESEALDQLLQQDLHTATRQLPPHMHAVFARFHFEEDSVVAISLSSGRSQEAIKKSLQRARHQMRRSLMEKGHGETVETTTKNRFSKPREK